MPSGNWDRFEQALLRMGDTSVYLCPAPLYHSAGALLVRRLPTSWAATVVIMERFDPERFLAVIERERVTHTQVVPTMLVRILKLDREVRDRYDLSSLECLVHARRAMPGKRSSAR